jgi:hypothetical protein
MSPLSRGLVVGIAVLVLGELLDAVLGWRSGAGRAPVWFDLLQAALIGYGAAIPGWLREGARGALRDLRPVLDEAGRAAAEAPRLLDPAPAARVAAALAGVALGLVLAANPASWPEGRPSASFFAWTLARAAAIGGLALYGAALAAHLALRLSGLGARVARVELLDPRAFAPLTRYGLRTVAIWMGFSALFALMFLAPFASISAAVALSATGAFAVLALLLPVGGARPRLRSARDSELARVRASIRARSEGAAGGAHPALSLADLLAYEARIRAVSSWVYDLGAWLRFAFYVALGLGSWVGAALVERGLGVVLG